MLDIKLNFSYTKGLPLYHFQDKKEPLPASYAIAWCMLATSVSRIFTKEDMKEFLFRLSITLHSLDLLENWLVKDCLMNYSVKGKQYVLTLDDIIIHFGMEICDAYANLVSREKYLGNLLNGLKGAMFVGDQGGFSVLKTEVREYEDGKQYNFSKVKNYIPEITPELITKAEFFATDLMKFIPNEIFENRNEAMLEKEKELRERQDKINKMPVFDIYKIPQETIRQCLEIIYIPEYAEKLMADKELFSKEAKPLIYLGWLYANDLLDFTDDLPESMEGIPLDFEDYQLEDGGVNLNITIENYNISELTPLLSGLLIN